MNCINLVVPMNPCPCGYYPDRNRCRCTAAQVKQYMGKVSGPILDRIDLCVELQPVELDSLKRKSGAEDSHTIRKRVQKARMRQEIRFSGTGYRFNGDIESGQIDRYCALGIEEEACMGQLYQTLHLSARAFHRILKVARTIADLEDAEEIQVEHLLEASYYRPTQEYWQA